MRTKRGRVPAWESPHTPAPRGSWRFAGHANVKCDQWSYFHCGLCFQVLCPTTTVGEVMERHHISRVSLLKINVERGEESVLLGVTRQDWPRIDQVEGGGQCAARGDTARLAPHCPGKRGEESVQFGGRLSKTSLN